MGNLAADLEPRKLFYRPHIKWLYYSILGLALLGETIVVVATIAIAIANQPSAAVAVLLGGSLPSLIIALEAWFLIRPLAFSHVQVFSDYIFIKRVNETLRIPFAEITGIKFSYLPYFGGWFALIMKEGKPRRFTVVLERSEMILDALAKFNPSLCDPEKLSGYRRTSVFADHSWARFYVKMESKGRFLFKYILYPICAATLLALIFGATRPKDIAAFNLKLLSLNGIVAYCFFIAEELLIGRRFAKAITRAPSALKRDIKMEAEIQNKTQRIYFCFSALLFLLVAFFRFIET